MSEHIAIKVEGVSKKFKLPHEKTTSIKSALINFYKSKKTYEIQQAVNDVSFDIKKGEFFGIVGRNGSGKSTLLKLISGIYAPTKGSISVHGKLTPFIELGVGFNPELTGRENVYLNGALLGFDRKQMTAMYQDIVNFAELHKFMDQKLKNYSSGMQVRLAFSIAIRAKSDILLLDEVLAVGDEAFQRKCLDVFEAYKASGQTVVLVTHDMETVRKFCSRAVLMGEGKLLAIGDPDEIATKYTKLNLKEITNDMENGVVANPKDAIIQAHIFNQQGEPTAQFKSSDTMVVKLEWPKSTPAEYAGVSIINKSGEYIFGANTSSDKHTITGTSVTYKVALDLGPGKYRVGASLSGKAERDVLDYLENGPEFIVTPNASDKSGGMVRLKHNWE